MGVYILIVSVALAGDRSNIILLVIQATISEVCINVYVISDMTNLVVVYGGILMYNRKRVMNKMWVEVEVAISGKEEMLAVSVRIRRGVEPFLDVLGGNQKLPSNTLNIDIHQSFPSWS